jgi:hypothetical protein
MKIYLGIDPGSSKTGWAWVSQEGDLLASGIVPQRQFEDLVIAVKQGNLTLLEPFRKEGDLSMSPYNPAPVVVLGNGTSAEVLMAILKSNGFDPVLVPEYGTTLGARELYWRIHPPRGLRKLFPLSLQVPPRDIDDLAAWKIVLDHIR